MVFEITKNELIEFTRFKSAKSNFRKFRVFSNLKISLEHTQGLQDAETAHRPNDESHQDAVPMQKGTLAKVIA